MPAWRTFLGSHRQTCLKQRLPTSHILHHMSHRNLTAPLCHSTLLLGCTGPATAGKQHSSEPKDVPQQLHKCSWGNQSCLSRCGSSRDKECSCSSTRRKMWEKGKTPLQISVPIQTCLPDYSPILIFQHCKKFYNYLQTGSLSSFFSYASGAGSSPIKASVNYRR